MHIGNKMKKIIILIVVIVLSMAGAFVVLDSKWYFEKYIKIQSPIPSVLISDFVSFQRIDEIVNRLERKGINWSVKSNNQSPSDGFRPEFNDYVIKIEGYSDRELIGDVELVFNNNRLYQVAFYPSNLAAYLKQFQGRSNIDLEKLRKVRTDKSIAIEYLTNYEGKEYIRWSDENIQNEVSKWIERFS